MLIKKATDYKLYPKNKERLIQEIVKVFDDYDNDELHDDVFIYLIRHYQEYSDEEEFIGKYLMDENFTNNFYVNSSFRRKIGKSRSNRLEKILSYSMETDI